MRWILVDGMEFIAPWFLVFWCICIHKNANTIVHSLVTFWDLGEQLRAASLPSLAPSAHQESMCFRVCVFCFLKNFKSWFQRNSAVFLWCVQCIITHLSELHLSMSWCWCIYRSTRLLFWMSTAMVDPRHAFLCWAWTTLAKPPFWRSFRTRTSQPSRPHRYSTLLFHILTELFWVWYIWYASHETIVFIRWVGTVLALAWSFLWHVGIQWLYRWMLCPRLQSHKGAWLHINFSTIASICMAYVRICPEKSRSTISRVVVMDILLAIEYAQTAQTTRRGSMHCWAFSGLESELWFCEPLKRLPLNPVLEWPL